MNKQIIISSDKAPHKLTNLQDRLVSRFQWNLIVEVTSPDFETRVAILKRKAKVELKALNAPDISFEGVEDIFQKAYEHEKTISCSINAIASLTEDECDLATRNFIDWYLKEQIEEEDNFLRIISKIKAFGSDSASSYLLDKEVGQREYNPASYE
jgi:ferritin